jgi:putative ABC transport system permease protein
MTFWSRLRLWGRAMLHRPRLEREMDHELRFHVETYAEDLVGKGVSREEALRRARIEFGGMESVKEESRAARGLSLLDEFSQDLRYGLRVLRKSPGFAVVAILTLALGIGANTAIFSVVNAVLLSPLPYADSPRLVLIKEVLPSAGALPMYVSGPDITPIRNLSHVFDGFAGFRDWTYELSGSGEPERIIANRASSELFPVLGVQPILGRNFSAEEERPGHPVAVLGYGLWQRRFGGSRDVLGQTVNLDRQPYTIIGVMPQSFVFPLPGMGQGAAADLWVPLALSNEELSDFGDDFSWGAVGRLKPGIRLTQANADLQLTARGVLDLYQQWARDAHMPLGDFQLGVEAKPLREEVTGPLKLTLWMLLGAVSFVLLIACVNVANLLLMRASGRQKETAVRLAIGAGRWRLLRQFLVEGLLLSAFGGVLGLALALWFKNAMVASMPASIPRFYPVALNWPVLLFTFLLIAATGCVFGAVPAFWSSRTNVNSSLQTNGRSHSQGPEHQRLRAAFVVVEVALSVILLVGAGLLVRSFERVLNSNPGFRPEHVLTASADLPPAQYPGDEQTAAFYKQLMRRLQQNPEVVAAGGSTDLPLLGQWNHTFTLEGSQPAPDVLANICYHSVIYGDYLQAMGIPLLRGRYFDEHDGPQATLVALVSEALAKKYWPGQEALGKRLKWGGPESADPWKTVVGIVGDVKQGPLDTAAALHTYQPYAQLAGARSLRIAVRTLGDPAAIAGDVRAAVRSLDRQLALGSVRTMDEVVSRSTASRRFSLALVGSFALLAVLLAAIGIYAVLAYSVARRTHEIGVRVALGARRGDVVRLVLGHSLRVTAIGMLIGVAGALGLTRALQSLLYEVSPTDPLTFSAVLLLLVGISLAASYLPMRRAMRVDPMVALRYE